VSKLEDKKSRVEKLQREKLDRFLPLQEEVLNHLYLVISHLQTEEETSKEEAKESEYPDMSMINQSMAGGEEGLDEAGIMNTS